MKLIFLDESGDHNLTVIDPEYPIFVLGGVIVTQAHLERVIEPAIRQLKFAFCGHDQIILHTSDIARNRRGFEGLIDPTTRQNFYQSLNHVMRALDFQVVACAIRKFEHRERYGPAAVDPYLLALNVLIERFAFEVGELEGGGAVIAECRNAYLDQAIHNAWAEIRRGGTQYLKGAIIDQRIGDFQLRAKAENVIGLQLADLVVSPIARAILGKASREDYEIVKAKFRRSPATGSHVGFGLVVLPKD